MANLIVKDNEIVVCSYTTNERTRSVMFNLLTRVVEDDAANLWGWDIPVVLPEFID